MKSLHTPVIFLSRKKTPRHSRYIHAKKGETSATAEPDIFWGQSASQNNFQPRIRFNDLASLLPETICPVPQIYPHSSNRGRSLTFRMRMDLVRTCHLIRESLWQTEFRDPPVVGIMPVTHFRAVASTSIKGSSAVRIASSKRDQPRSRPLAIFAFSFTIQSAAEFISMCPFAARDEIETQRVRAMIDWRQGIGQIGDPANLDPEPAFGLALYLEHTICEDEIAQAAVAKPIDLLKSGAGNSFTNLTIPFCHLRLISWR